MFVLLFPIIAALYFVPTIIGLRKRDVVSIFALNLLLGWTFVGWVAALVWALKTDTPAITNSVFVASSIAPASPAAAPMATTAPAPVRACSVCRLPIKEGGSFCSACGSAVVQ
jgi:hypothetical protein